MSFSEIGIAGYQTSCQANYTNRQTSDKRFVLRALYGVCESENYRVVPDNAAECIDVYDRQGEPLGTYDYADLAARQDAQSGKQLLISEHGALDYDAMVLDDEMKENLKTLMGGGALNVQRLQGYTLMTNPDTGIQYLVRQGEEGRGGTLLFQSDADMRNYDALAQTYASRYPNLIGSMDEAYIWAELEIKGLAYRTEDGIVGFGYGGAFYHDNADPTKDWSVSFSGSVYQEISGLVQSGSMSEEQMQEQSTWQNMRARTDEQKQPSDAFWERREREMSVYRMKQRKRRISREAKARKEQRRQAKIEQEIKRKRRARYVRIMEESSWKRKLQSQESIRNYYQSGISAEVVSFIVSDRETVRGRTEGCVRCTFADKNPDKLETVYYVYYSPEGIRCIREGERNPRHPAQKIGIDVLQWEIPLDDAGQYERVAGFLADFSNEDDLCFTVEEGFWREFLEDGSNTAPVLFEEEEAGGPAPVFGTTRA